MLHISEEEKGLSLSIELPETLRKLCQSAGLNHDQLLNCVSFVSLQVQIMTKC